MHSVTLSIELCMKSVNLISMYNVYQYKANFFFQIGLPAFDEQLITQNKDSSVEDIPS